MRISGLLHTARTRQRGLRCLASAARQARRRLAKEQPAARGVGGGIAITKDRAMGRNVTLGIGTLIIILIVVALIF